MIITTQDGLAETIRALQPGDELLMRGGTYRTPIIRTRNSGEADAPITVKAYPGEVVRIEPEDGYNLWHIITGSHWRFEYVDFGGVMILANVGDTDTVNDIAYSHCSFTDGRAGLSIQSVNGLRIEHTRFENVRSGIPGTDHSAIALRRHAKDVVVADSQFIDVGSDGVHVGANGTNIGRVAVLRSEFVITGRRSPVGENGVDIKAGYVTVSQCRFSGFRDTVAGQDASGAQGEAIVIHPPWLGGPRPTGAVITHNTLEDNEHHIWIAHADDVTIAGNIMRGAVMARFDGIALYVNDSSGVIAGNEFTNNPVNAILNELSVDLYENYDTEGNAVKLMEG